MNLNRTARGSNAFVSTAMLKRDICLRSVLALLQRRADASVPSFTSWFRQARTIATGTQTVSVEDWFNWFCQGSRWQKTSLTSVIDIHLGSLLVSTFLSMRSSLKKCPPPHPYLQP